MPTFIAGKDNKILFGIHDLTSYFSDASFSREQAVNETTTFGSDQASYIGSIESASASLTGFYDGDTEIDKLVCNYWDRWGSMICEVQSSIYGIIKTNFGCKRVGILATKTRGMVDLVCNRFSKLTFNGVQYTNTKQY